MALPQLTRNKPAVFTLHDMWNFTGHCAYSYDCSKWQKACGQCPYPQALPAIQRDATNLEWKLKDWAYSLSNLNIVTPTDIFGLVALETAACKTPIVSFDIAALYNYELSASA